MKISPYNKSFGVSKYQPEILPSICWQATKNRFEAKDADKSSGAYLFYDLDSKKIPMDNFFYNNNLNPKSPSLTADQSSAFYLELLNIFRQYHSQERIVGPLHPPDLFVGLKSDWPLIYFIRQAKGQESGNTFALVNEDWQLERSKIEDLKNLGWLIAYFEFRLVDVTLTEFRNYFEGNSEEEISQKQGIGENH